MRGRLKMLTSTPYTSSSSSFSPPSENVELCRLRTRPFGKRQSRTDSGRFMMVSLSTEKRLPRKSSKSRVSNCGWRFDWIGAWCWDTWVIGDEDIETAAILMVLEKSGGRVAPCKVEFGVLRMQQGSVCYCVVQIRLPQSSSTTINFKCKTGVGALESLGFGAPFLA